LRAPQDTIKHGIYKRYKYGRLIEVGTYQQNTKEGEWRYYHSNKTLIACGHYHQNEKVNTWSFYSIHGVLIQKYDYDTQQLIYFNREEEAKYANTNSDPEAELQVPVFIGDTGFMQTLIQNNVRYPKVAWDKQVSGKCYVKFIVDTLGYTTNAMVDSKSNLLFAKAAVDVVNSLGKCWIPGRMGQKKVPVYFIIPVSFKPE